jgi:predicted N-acyltransferase
MDHQAHVSMQDTIAKLQTRGITTGLIRHSSLGELEKRIQELSQKHRKIWYCLDGVYSMYGDLSPIRELGGLMHKYGQLHLYIDDAHGMSWAGPNGAGYILSQIPLQSRIVLTTSLAKGFGSSGGVFIMPDQELYWRVRNWGGALTYSGPQQPAVIGASIASAKIHLSKEIKQRQDQLMRLIHYCNQKMEAFGLPVIMPSPSPIFFVGLGLTRVGYNMARRMMDDGLYVNLGIFPAVPETCTGIRFTLTSHHTADDIDQLIERLAYHLPRALQEEGRTLDDVHRAFRSVTRFRENTPHGVATRMPSPVSTEKPAFRLECKNSILDINKQLWEELMGNNVVFDWNSLALLEDTFRDNQRPEDNWDFHYYMIKDQAGKPILATFFTAMLTKDDMLASAGISLKIEDHRRKDFYYLTSRSLMMGTPITEGQHLYLDKSHPHWRNALMLLLDTVWREQDRQRANAVYLRDFTADDLQMRDFFIDQGFIKTDLPASHVIELPPCDSLEAYLEQLNHKKRRHVRKDALLLMDRFEVKRVENPSPAEMDHLYGLYENVYRRSFEINMFKLPRKFYENIIQSPHWEITAITLKPEYDHLGKRRPVAVAFSYRNADYSPVMVGIDYDYLETAKVYKQIILQVLNRAIALKSGKVQLGFTASETKRTFGAVVKPQVAYVQMKDNFDTSQLYLQSSV